MASRNPKLHGKVEGATGRCAVPGCKGRGEYRAPVQPANFDGPGAYRLLCLDHVREHNTRYNYFAGMSPEEISDAQSPLAGWERPSRRFAHNGADPLPAWADFADPLEAIAASFRRADRGPPQRFTKEERRARRARLGRGRRTARRPPQLFQARPAIPPRPEWRRP